MICYIQILYLSTRESSVKPGSAVRHEITLIDGKYDKTLNDFNSAEDIIETSLTFTCFRADSKMDPDNTFFSVYINRKKNVAWNVAQFNIRSPLVSWQFIPATVTPMRKPAASTSTHSTEFGAKIATTSFLPYPWCRNCLARTSDRSTNSFPVTELPVSVFLWVINQQTSVQYLANIDETICRQLKSNFWHDERTDIWQNKPIFNHPHNIRFNCWWIDISIWTIA